MSPQTNVEWMEIYHGAVGSSRTADHKDSRARFDGKFERKPQR
jgi:hypothetical protein